MNERIFCIHYENGQQIPCPPMCPYQTWQKFMFRKTFLLGRWKLRKQYKTYGKNPFDHMRKGF